MAGETLAELQPDRSADSNHIAVKEAVFPFARFPGVDTVLGPEMRSTGEVMGLDRDFALAFAKSQLGGGTRAAARGHGLRLGARRATSRASLEAVRACSQRSASRCWRPRGTPALPRPTTASPPTKVNKVLEGRPHIVDAIKNGEVQLVFNTTEGAQALADSRSLRRAALLHKVPYYTTLAGAVAAAQGIRAYLGGDLEVRTLQSYFSET